MTTNLKTTLVWPGYVWWSAEKEPAISYIHLLLLPVTRPEIQQGSDLLNKELTSLLIIKKFAVNKSRESWSNF